MDNQMGVEIYSWAVRQENVQAQDMEPNASFLHDYDGGDSGDGGDGDDEAWVLD